MKGREKDASNGDSNHRCRGSSKGCLFWTALCPSRQRAGGPQEADTTLFLSSYQSGLITPASSFKNPLKASCWRLFVRGGAFLPMRCGWEASSCEGNQMMPASRPARSSHISKAGRYVVTQAVHATDESGSLKGGFSPATRPPRPCEGRDSFSIVVTGLTCVVLAQIRRRKRFPHMNSYQVHSFTVYSLKAVRCLPWPCGCRMTRGLGLVASLLLSFAAITQAQAPNIQGLWEIEYRVSLALLCIVFPARRSICIFLKERVCGLSLMHNTLEHPFQKTVG